MNDQINKLIERNKSYTKCNDDFIKESNLKYNNFYTYQKTQYKNCKEKVTITCNLHGDYEQTPSQHLSNTGGCLMCKKEHKLEKFIKNAKQFHGDNFDYSKTIYEQPKIKIICKKHGEFKQTMAVHLLSSSGGCKKCANILRSKNIPTTIKSNSKFIQECSIIHKNKYDYSLVQYTGKNNKIEIICPTHGIFIQVADYHISGNGCQLCAISNKSKMEIEWLNVHKIPNEYRNVKITIEVNNYIVDGIDMKTNTIYEFWGDYWHGNPKKYNSNDINQRCKKTFGELYENTLKKIDIITRNGYNLIQIWESEWKNEIRVRRFNTNGG